MFSFHPFVHCNESLAERFAGFFYYFCFSCRRLCCVKRKKMERHLKASLYWQPFGRRTKAHSFVMEIVMITFKKGTFFARIKKVKIRCN